MNLVLLSEHYEPRVGGVTSFINSLCTAIHQLGHQIWLVVPGENQDGEITESEVDFGSLVSIGTDLDLTAHIPSRARVLYCKRACDWIRYFSKENEIDAVHVLFGLYLMRHLNLTSLPQSVFKGCTIHNIPPQECATSWEGDGKMRFWKDLLRQKLVGLVNRRRIRSQSWDSYVVPSHYVANELSKIVDTEKVKVIGHGVQTVGNVPIMKNRRPPFRFLTVSGFTPHKCLHIIPSVLKRLLDEGFDVCWDVVGPNKNHHYVKGILLERATQNVELELNFHFSVSSVQLMEFFQSADVYIHTSKEEGFCLAVLEAATYGLPVIGRPTGAIPEIIESGMGELYDNVEDLNGKILKVIQDLKCYQYSVEDLKVLKSEFSWYNAAKKYLDIFQAKTHL